MLLLDISDQISAIVPLKVNSTYFIYHVINCRFLYYVVMVMAQYLIFRVFT